MKEKGIIILSLLLIASLILAGCSGGPSAAEIATSEANDALQNLNEAIADGDEAAITNYISDDGVTVVDNTSNNTEDYTKEQFITSLSSRPDSILILNLVNKTTQVNGDIVTISGEPSGSLRLPSGTQILAASSDNNLEDNLITTGNLAGTFIQENLSDNSTDSLTTQDTYSGTNFSVEHPDNWNSLSISETTSEILMAVPNSQKTSIAMWQDDVFTPTNTLNEVMSNLNTTFSDMASKPELPNLDNLNFIDNDNTDYAAAKDYAAAYDINYKPLIVEIKLQNEGDTYKITQITIGQSSSVKTISVTEKGIVINNSNDLYFINYGGNDDVYSENEANNIFNSFEILTP